MKAKGIAAIGFIIGIVVLFTVALGLIALYNAFVLATLWGWFIVPLGIAKIGLAHAYGLLLIPAVILSTRGLHAPEDKRKEAIFGALLIPAMALLFGWIALGFM